MPSWPRIRKRWRLRSVASVPSSRSRSTPGGPPTRRRTQPRLADRPTCPNTDSRDSIRRRRWTRRRRGVRRRRVRRPNLRQLRPGHGVPRQRALPRGHQRPLPEPGCTLRAHQAQRRGARRLPRAARPAASTAVITVAPPSRWLFVRKALHLSDAWRHRWCNGQPRGREGPVSLSGRPCLAWQSESLVGSPAGGAGRVIAVDVRGVRFAYRVSSRRNPHNPSSKTGKSRTFELLTFPGRVLGPQG